MTKPLKECTGLSTGTSALRTRPQLVAHIGYIASIWSDVEATLHSIVATLSGSNSHLISAMFQPVINTSIQIDMINALIIARGIPTDMQTDFMKVIKDFRKRARPRNIIVHGHWAVPHPDQNHLVLIPNHARKKFALAAAARSVGEGPPVDESLRDLYTSGIMYNEKDFEDIEQKLNEYAGELQRLRGELASWAREQNEFPIS